MTNIKYKNNISFFLILFSFLAIGFLSFPLTGLSSSDGYIYEGFDDSEVINYAGGNGFQASVKSSTGGIQKVTEASDGNELQIAVKYIDGAKEHDSFIQSSEPMEDGEIFTVSCTLRIPDSTTGVACVNLIFGTEKSVAKIYNGEITYIDGSKEAYIDNSSVNFAMVLDTVSGKLDIFRNNVYIAGLYDVKTLDSSINLTKIRPRIHALAYNTDDKYYEMFADDIYAARNDMTEEFSHISAGTKKLVDGGKTNASYFKDGLYTSNICIGYNKSDDRNIKLLMAHYKISGAVGELADIKSESYTLHPGINKLDLPFSINGSNSTDIFKLFFMPEEDYNMIFSKLISYEAGKFNNPSGNEMTELLKANNPDNMHPRIWLNDNEIQRLKSLILIDDVANEWYQSIKADAAVLYSKSLPVYEDDDPQRLACSQTVANAIPLFSFIYLIDGDTDYAKRAYEYMKTVCEFPAWEPNHFLDTSNITMAVSIGYDWLYDYLQTTDTPISYFEENIAQKGLEMGRDAYLGTLYTGNYWWVDALTNWNVCSNSGMAIGAMAIGDVSAYSDLCGFILEMSLDSLQKMMISFAPDGAWFEGPSYWLSTVSPLCNMAYTFESVFGTDFNVMQSEGLSNTAYYPIMNMGTEASFNLHDAGEDGVDSPQLWYLADKYNDKNVAGYRLYQLQNNICKPSYKDLLWYNPTLADADFDNDIKKDGYFRNLEIALFRNTYKGTDINFAGIHGGKNLIEHGQLDAGTFVYEAGGERWAVDLGGELYNMYNYWVMDDVEKSRWGYYRSRAEGHNTLVINPSALADQDLECDSKISKFVSNDNYGYSIVDLDTAYQKYASSVKRGMRIDKANGNLVVQDELTLIQISDVYWFMHTKAEVELRDGGKTALLTQNNKKLIVKINGDGVFTVMDAAPMATSPNPDEWTENKNNAVVPGRSDTHQSINTGVKKLAIFYDDAPAGNMTINVSMGLDNSYEDVSITKLNDWR